MELYDNQYNNSSFLPRKELYGVFTVGLYKDKSFYVKFLVYFERLININLNP